MAVQKNTNDLLSQAATNLPNNTTQQISPQDIREMAENLAVSSFNKITDSALVGLKSYNTLVTYESGQACINGSDIYIANQITGPGAFNAAHWTLFKSGSGTQNKLAKFGANGAVTNSSITDNGTNYLFSLLNTNGFVKTNGGTGQLSVSSQVSATEGGTGKSSWVAGSIPYISATNTFGEVTAAGNDGKFLSLVAGVPTWATMSVPNLGTQDLTATQADRAFSLYGSTNGSSFAIKNAAGSIIAKYYGAGQIDFGYSSSYTTCNFYTDSAITDNIKIYSGATPWVFFNSNERQVQFRGLSGYDITFNGSGKITAKGSDGGFSAINTSGTIVGSLEVEGSCGWFYLKDSSAVNQAYFYPDGGQYYFKSGLSLGYAAPGAPAAILDVKGTGNTSGTINTLIRNLAGTAALTIKDDLSATFGGDVVFSQSTNSTATGANARITSHPTSTIVLTNASLTSIGSIIAGASGGHIVTLMNETGASITIVDAYGSAAAGEVIYTNTASNLTIRNNCGATFQYNATGACWTKI